MSPDPTVLLLGATGRTGRLVLTQLLGRGARVRAVVRCAERLPAGVADDPRLTVVVADLLSQSDDDVAREVGGCDAVVSCLGHSISVGGVFGRPRDLVVGATEKVCRAIRQARRDRPVRLVIMSSVSVNGEAVVDGRRGPLERAMLWALRGLLPPARDNQRAADFLREAIGTADPYVQWSAVRPDTLRRGDVTGYGLHEGLVNSLLRPAETNMANVAHFMCELATDAGTWAAWRGKLPVIVNAPR